MEGLFFLFGFVAAAVLFSLGSTVSVKEDAHTGIKIAEYKGNLYILKQLLISQPVQE
ncbi:MAG: hypothetical protein LBQ10_07220 [Desulfovibrio sp.]|jgi:hypothetical protein|nr:hypothetical protein [Desulfovibrio sp.]